MRLTIPPLLKDIWPKVIGLQPGEFIALQEYGYATKNQIIAALRKAVRVSERAGLLEGYTIVFKPVLLRPGSWSILIQKVALGQPVMLQLEEGGDQDSQ